MKSTAEANAVLFVYPRTALRFLSGMLDTFLFCGRIL